MKKIIVELDSPIDYSNGSGVEIEGSFIEINEPTGKQAHLVAIFRSEIGTATRNALKGMDLGDAKDSDDKDDSEPDSEERGVTAFTMLTMGGADMKKVMITLKELLIATSSIASDKDFKASMYDRMSYSDVEKTLKAYLGNFIPA